MTALLALVTALVPIGSGLAGDEPGPSRAGEAPATLARAPEDSIRGRTIRWTWTEGPVEGGSHEHVFRTDGTVRWTVLSGPRKGHSAEEAAYAVHEVSETVYAVSYLASSGYTLTVVLNFSTGEMFGFASGQGQWHPGRGTFAVVR